MAGSHGDVPKGTGVLPPALACCCAEPDPKICWEGPKFRLWLTGLETQPHTWRTQAPSSGLLAHRPHTLPGGCGVPTPLRLAGVGIPAPTSMAQSPDPNLGQLGNIVPHRENLGRGGVPCPALTIQRGDSAPGQDVPPPATTRRHAEVAHRQVCSGYRLQPASEANLLQPNDPGSHP